MKIYKLIALLGVLTATVSTIHTTDATKTENKLEIEKTSSSKHKKKMSKKHKESKHFHRKKRDSKNTVQPIKKGLSYEEAEINEYLDLV